MGAEVTCCINCKFWDTEDIDLAGVGECKRFPPYTGEDSYMAIWPETVATDWCGEGMQK